MRGFKILTHDYRPPVQQGDPVWDGVTLPYDLPVAKLDLSETECGAGWNFCADIAPAARIAGLWKNGCASAVLEVEAVGTVVERGDKIRTDRLVIVGRADRATMVEHLGRPFGNHAARMGESQVAWWEALGSERRKVRNVERGLRQSLKARGLDGWKLRRYDTAWDAWAARDAWDAWAARDARDARAAWAAWAARAAWAAWAARAAWAAWDARDAWAARDARAAWAARDARDAWAAWDAWDAWAARDALTVEYAALNNWTNHDPMLLTTGIRDAYANGLAIAVPVAPNTLGWALR